MTGPALVEGADRSGGTAEKEALAILERARELVPRVAATGSVRIFLS
jgi:hypothetical protein